MSVVRPKPKKLHKPITTGTNNKINQPGTEANTGNNVKRGETRASKSRLVLVLLLIG